MPGAITAADAKTRVHGSGEVALLDVREHGQFGEGHPFLAVPCPFSTLEFAIGDLVPRVSVSIILIDSGDGIAERCAAILTRLGYTNVSWIIDGVHGWAAAGFTLFKGVNLPSKTLGELLEHEWHVPSIDVETLDEWRSTRTVNLFDGRPAQEFRKASIPGARSLPNGELPHRFGKVSAGSTAPVIVHCAGRTRSIVGAAGLALAGVGNPIFALENGTQGWTLSGRKLALQNKPEALPELDAVDLERSRASARAICSRYEIPLITRNEITALASDSDRTLYLLDVRSAEEFAAGTSPNARSAPCVQIVQATDQWVGVRRARIALTCDTGLRSAIAATFLQALGYDVYVVPDAQPGAKPNEGPKLNSILADVSAREAMNAVKGGAILLDARNSIVYRAGHLDGACWCIRPRLPDMQLPIDAAIFVAGETPQAKLIADDLVEAGYTDVRLLTGSLSEWASQGLPIVQTPKEPDDASAIDFLFFVHDRHDGNMESAKRYLEWEMGLVAQLDPAERNEYRIGPSPFAR
ncbi:MULTISPECIES: rhodanese-like domain-containing protein [Mesorhizobium]|nr:MULTISPECIES: rhodanese-like domain-containing protein [Mesorhizobium]